MEKAICSILEYLVDNAEEVCKDKHSGMYDTPLGYRIHKGSFMPRALDKYLFANDLIAHIVRTTSFSKLVRWDDCGLWITIIR